MTIVAGSILGFACGCYSFLNSWLDPTKVGNFLDEGTFEIRSSLSIQDSPPGIPGATEPTPEDLEPVPESYRLEAGDTINVRIFELIAEHTEMVVQTTLDEEGVISLPVLGGVRASGMTARELEAELADILRQRDILVDAQVIVDPLVKRAQTYTIYGAIANPSIYPITRPTFRVLEAINVAGGLLDTVTDIYVIRKPREQGYSSLGAARDMGRVRRVIGGSQAAGAGLAMSDGLSDAVSSSARRKDGPASGPAPEPDLEDVTPLNRVLDDPEAEREVIEAVIGGEQDSSPRRDLSSQAVEPATTSAASEPAVTIEPSAQPRFIFLNGKWIEVKPPTSQPEPGRIAVEEPPGPPPVAAPRPAETRPVVDWSQIAGETEQRIIRVSPDGLRDGDARQDIIIRPGDSIRVMAGEVGEYYIMGQVIRPGAYSVTGRRVTLKQAVASAGNIAPLGWPDRCTVYRRYGDREEMKQVNLDAIFAGKEADLFIKKDDLIVVGTHPVAPFLAVIRNAFRMTYGFGFVYDRNFADIDSYGGQPNPAFQQERFPNLFR